MSDPDPNWFYSSLAQSAAAIVGLIGAFVTSRVMMMASERSQIENRINEINAETKELERQNSPLIEYIAEIDKKKEEENREKDDETVIAFLQTKKSMLNLKNLPTDDEMLKELREGNEIEIPDDKFNSMFKEKYKAWIEEKNEDKEGKNIITNSWMAINACLSGLNKLQVPLFINPITSNKPIFTSIKPTFNIRYNNSKETLEKNKKEISNGEAKIQELQHQLKQIVLPKHFIYLTISLIYFTLVGVILPLWLIPITSEQHLIWRPFVQLFFITGLIAVFSIIFIEIKHITKK